VFQRDAADRLVKSSSVVLTGCVPNPEALQGSSMTRGSLSVYVFATAALALVFLRMFGADGQRQPATFDHTEREPPTNLTEQTGTMELIRFPGHQMEPVSSWSPEHGKEPKNVHRRVQA
jgi:hypothetical protein